MQPAAENVSQWQRKKYVFGGLASTLYPSYRSVYNFFQCRNKVMGEWHNGPKGKYIYLYILALVSICRTCVCCLASGWDVKFFV